MRFTFILYVSLIFGSLINNNVSGLEAKFTPNPNDDSGPLPASQKQRDQLLQLEQAIVNSADPQATLEQVAASNGMDPNDLVSMLERNRQEMQQVGGGGGGGGGAPTLPQQVGRLLSGAIAVTMQAANKNPKLFSGVAAVLLCILYISIMAPRNGMLISQSNGILSKGHTTIFNPPTAYVKRFLESPRYTKSIPSLKETRLDLEGISPKDGVEYHNKLGRKSPDLSCAVTGQVTLHLSKFVPDSLVKDKKDDDINAIRARVAEILYEEAAIPVLEHRRFTEFASDHQERFQCSGRKSAVLVLPKAGDWGYYGLQPLRIAQQSEGETYALARFSTLKGGFFDGQLNFSVERTRTGNVLVQVNLLIPKKGRKLKKRLATSLVERLVTSMGRSIETEANKKLARQLQGKRFTEEATKRFTERRHLRHEKEKELEDMSTERARRWKRSSNPNGGRFRPSGDRQRSPNNC